MNNYKKIVEGINSLGTRIDSFEEIEHCFSTSEGRDEAAELSAAVRDLAVKAIAYDNLKQYIESFRKDYPYESNALSHKMEVLEEMAEFDITRV